MKITTTVLREARQPFYTIRCSAIYKGEVLIVYRQMDEGTKWLSMLNIARSLKKDLKRHMELK